MEYQFSNKVLPLKPSAIREIFKVLEDPTVISLAGGNPDPQSFPVQDMSDIAADLFQNHAAEALQYGITEGYRPLRKAVSDRLREKFQTGSDFDELIITSGGQQGIELCCKALCNEGDTVLCETPSFIGGLNAFKSYNVNLVGVPLEEDGIDLTKLEQALKTEKNVRLLYLIPTFQNPAGICTSLAKRRAVYELCKQYGVIIIEDNPYGELRFAGEDLPTIKSMDTEGIVVYCGSFSKILSAGMRIGFVCAPAPVITKMVVCKQISDVHTNQFFQMLVYQYMTTRDLDGHIREVRSIYRRKCGAMLKALDEMMDPRVTYTRPEGGLFLWCTLPEGTDLVAFTQAALREKVAIVPGTAFMPSESDPTTSFRLNYSLPTEQQIHDGIAVLSRVAKEFLK